MKKLSNRLIAVLLCVVMVLGSGTAAFAASSTAAARLYDLETEVGFSVVPLDADGNAVVSASVDLDGDRVDETVYSEVEKLSLSFTGTAGKEYTVYLLYGAKVPNETSLRYIYQNTCDNSNMNFTIVPTQMAEAGTYYVYVASDIYALAATFSVTGPESEEEEKAVAAVTYTDDGAVQTVNASNIEAAMSLAKSVAGEGAENVTVQLLEDGSVKDMLVYPGVTLDLNGFTLSAEYVVGFNGSNVADSSAANTGLLKAARNSVILAADNSQLPVWDGEGYRFFEIEIKTNLQMNTEAYPNAAYFRFYIVKNGDWQRLYTLLSDTGAAAHDLSVMVKIGWTTSDGNAASQYYAYSESVVINMANAQLGGKTGMFNCLLTGVNSRSDITFSAVLLSGTKVELAKLA